MWWRLETSSFAEEFMRRGIIMALQGMLIRNCKCCNVVHIMDIARIYDVTDDLIYSISLVPDNIEEL